MQLGIVGLGRMGAGMARRLARGGARVICHDDAEAAREAIADEPNIECVGNLAALCARLDGERVVVLALATGAAVERAIGELVPLASAGDTVVDVGNSYYRESMRHALALSQLGLRYIDAGVCGGRYGAEQGYGLMLGGTPRSIEIFEPVARMLAPTPESGWLHCGPSGAGHFAAMIHGGVQCAIRQALAEGFALLAARSDLDIDAERLAETWRRAGLPASSPANAGADSAEVSAGRWAALDSIELGVPAPILMAAFMAAMAKKG